MPERKRIRVTKRKRKPAEARFNLVAANLLDNGGDLKKAMVDAGYPKNKSTTALTQNPNFMELLDEAGVTDNKLANKLAEGLEATKSVVMGGGEFIDVQPDFATRHKYLETLLKVKGHMTAHVENKMNISIKYKPLLAGDTAHSKPIEGVKLERGIVDVIEAQVVEQEHQKDMRANNVSEDDSDREAFGFNQED
jgi:hypothetical protein